MDPSFEGRQLHQQIRAAAMLQNAGMCQFSAQWRQYCDEIVFIPALHFFAGATTQKKRDEAFSVWNEISFRPYFFQVLAHYIAIWRRT